MVAGLAADRNRRPPTALLLAEGLETIAQQMESARLSAPTSRETPNSPPPEATVVTNPSMVRPPAPAVSQPAAYPPVSHPATYPPVSQPTPPPPSTAAAAPEPVLAASMPSSYAPELYNPEPAYPVSMATAEPEPPARRRASYYILLSIAALALFAISMFVTILLLS